MVSLLPLVLLIFIMEVQSLHPVLYRNVHIFNEQYSIPYNVVIYPNGVTKNVTTLLIAEKNKLRFIINTAIGLTNHSNFTAFTMLCWDCDEITSQIWSSRGLHVIRSAALLEMAEFAFRENGPMPSSAVTQYEDMRRHNKHQLYRELIKMFLLEHGMTVLLIDIDLCFLSPVPFAIYSEDIIAEGYWPTQFRPNEYSFRLGMDFYVALNNGVSMFTPTLPMLQFGRSWMGFIFSEAMTNYGFSQTAFMKLFNETGLVLREDTTSGSLYGVNNYGLSVRAIQMDKYSFHAAGGSSGGSWQAKESRLKKAGRSCWILPDTWHETWKAESFHLYDFASLSSMLESINKNKEHH